MTLLNARTVAAPPADTAVTYTAECPGCHHDVTWHARPIDGRAGTVAEPAPHECRAVGTEVETACRTGETGRLGGQLHKSEAPTGLPSDGASNQPARRTERTS